MRHNRLLWISAALIALWFIIDTFLLSPSFGGEDIYYFKDPGANLAEGLGFVSRFTYGNPGFDYKVYAQYPPIYPLLYGLFAKAFGVSLLSNQVFNSLNNLSVGLLGFFTLKPMFTATGKRYAPPLMGAVLVFSILFSFLQPQPDRPEPLAVSLGLLTFIILRKRETQAALITAGVLCAVTFFTSPFVSIFTSIIAAIIVCSRAHSVREAGLRTASLIGGAVAAGLCLIIVISLALPGWLSAFIGVFTGASTKNEAGGGYFLLLLKGDIKGWFAGFGMAHASSILKLIIAQIAVLAALIWDRPKDLKADFMRWDGKWIALLLLFSPACLILMPYQSNYMNVSACMLLAAVATICVLMTASSRPVYLFAVTAAFIALNLIGAQDVIRSQLIRATLGPSLERSVSFVRAHREDFSQPGTYFAAASQNYMLWRQEGLHPLIVAYSGFTEGENREKLSAIALGYRGSGDAKTPKMPAWPMPDFQLCHQPELPQISSLFGVKLSKSSQTWEPAIYHHHSICEQ